MINDKKKFILFGAGLYGCEALSQIGDNVVEYFCDNNKKLIDTYVHGKWVISFNELKEIHKDYVIVVCANYLKSYSIILRLEENEIYDYLPYVLLHKKYSSKE